MVNATINGIAISVEDGTTILEAARKVGVEIPTLCYLKEVNEIGACRVCVVEVEGQDRCVTACNNVVQEGMVIRTNTRKVRTTRKTNVKFILSQHDYECASCVRSGNCTLQSLANELNISEMPYDSILEKNKWDKTFPLIRENNKCIKCINLPKSILFRNPPAMHLKLFCGKYYPVSGPEPAGRIHGKQPVVEIGSIGGVIVFQVQFSLFQIQLRMNSADRS